MFTKPLEYITLPSALKEAYEEISKSSSGFLRSHNFVGMPMRSKTSKQNLKSKKDIMTLWEEADIRFMNRHIHTL